MLEGLRTWVRRSLRIAGIALLMMGAAARAGGGPTGGVENLLWPAIIVTAPFFMVHDLVYGSDELSRKAADAEAGKVLDAFRETVPANGLYTGGTDLRWALYGMLVESRLPSVEVDVAGSVWLLRLAKDPERLIEQAQQHQYIRLTIGSNSNADCFEWKSTIDDWTAQPPVRPGSCLRITFGDELRSNLELRVDATDASRRKLRWQLVDRAAQKLLMSVPFWEAQVKGQPLRVTATYRSVHEDYTFIRILRKLSPHGAPVRADGLPFVMSRPVRRPAPLSPSPVKGEFRALTMDTASLAAPGNESWPDGYARAVSRKKPVIINNRLLIDPLRDEVGPACDFPARCDFACNSLSPIGVLMVNYNPAYAGESRIPPSEMTVTVAARSFDGEHLWFVRITPVALPAGVAACRDLSRSCYFYPEQATTTERELVVSGQFSGRDVALPRGTYYELVVPLAEVLAAAPVR